MKTTVTTKNFNIQEVQAYAMKMKELVDYIFTEIYSCRNFGSFHFNKKMGTGRFANNDPERDNEIFSVQRVSKCSFSGWPSKVQNNPYPYKFEYYDNGTLECLEITTINEEDPNHKRVDYHKFYTKEQLEDEGFLFQQQLVLDEAALFGVCCASWLWHMGVRLTYIICEFDVDEMNRVHKVVFDDDRP